jgi:hypothetical protein
VKTFSGLLNIYLKVHIFFFCVSETFENTSKYRKNRHLLGFSLQLRMQIFLSRFLDDAHDANDLNYKHGLLQVLAWTLLVKHVEFLNELWLSRRHRMELIVPGAVVPLYFFKIILNILEKQLMVVRHL